MTRPAPPVPTKEARGWSLAMTWHDLLFAHWPIASEALRALLPRTDPPLDLDLRDGAAWLGIVPFRMSGIRFRWLPPVPGTAAFPELNVRTYVTAHGRPGVWFFSLDAASPLAVRAARATFHLPYFDADMACAADGDGVRYRSRRTHRGGGEAQLEARYRPAGEVFRSAPGSLEHWLTERYRLFAADRRGRLWRGEIQHGPWPLQPAAVEFAALDMTRWLGLGLPATPPHLLFARRLEVRAWRLGPA
ncbi:MAG: YqjF family protein [Limisphaerales bacterium]